MSASYLVCWISFRRMVPTTDENTDENTAERLRVLISYWRTQGVRPAKPADEIQIATFEHRNGVQIIPDFREYLEAVNGMHANSECDSNIFSFWNLDRIRPVREECPELQLLPADGNYFVFADYMIWSWAYAVDLALSSSTAGRVILIGGRRQQVVSPTFGDFLRMYMEDSANIYALPA